jgi:aspartyl-tRNA(Asn)/glutamyl-tRNA(Gln) amidotransferase subunit C
MPIEIDIAHVARLARLRLDDDVLAAYKKQCADILEHAGRVQALDTEGIEPTAHPLPMTNAFREDVVMPERVIDRAEVLAQAPETEGPYIRVPRALEES